MIKINLLPKEKRSKDTRFERELLILALIAVASLGILTSVFTLVSSELAALDKTKQRLDLEDKFLTAKTGKFKEIENKLNAIKPKLLVIRTIREGQTKPVQFLDELTGAIQGERIWFESLVMEEDGRTSLNGVAIDNHSLALYTERLRKSPHIRAVWTERTSRRDVQGIGLVEFQCKISAVVPDTKIEQEKAEKKPDRPRQGQPETKPEAEKK